MDHRYPSCKVEGYIEVDGQVVSKAAEKAYAVYAEIDKKEKKRVEEVRKEFDRADVYFQSQEAKDEFLSIVKQNTSKDLRRPNVPAIRDALVERNKLWGWADTEELWYVPFSRSIDEVRVKVQYDKLRFIRYYEQAPHYLQYFNLKGKVMFPLSEYQLLLPYMED